jgi:hypothetical protein
VEILERAKGREGAIAEKGKGLEGATIEICRGVRGNRYSGVISNISRANSTF